MSEPTPPTSPAPTPPIVARASNTVRNKNLLILLMCLAMACWFAYDGFIGWPARNDILVQSFIAPRVVGDPLYHPPEGWDLQRDGLPSTLVSSWKGWNNADADARTHMSDIANALKTEGWKTQTDINNQKYIVLALILATLGAVGWFIHCQKRRAIADGDTVSPAPGITIPWTQITVVDNTRWKSMGIVAITYDLNDGQGPRKSKFDDYETDREPLLLILDQLAEKAVNAEFIPREEPVENAPETTPKDPETAP